MIKIAIIGKPNVGKSTIFNRFLKKKYSITSEVPGTTRDRIIQKVDFEGYELSFIDTSGLQYGELENMEMDMKAQANVAIFDADIILFVLDITNELNIDDFSVAEILRKAEKPILLIANKFDNPELENNIYAFYELGFGEPILLSAIHKIGMENLKEKILKSLIKIKAKKKKLHKKPQEVTNIAILGKPNAGKSSLVNSLSGSNRVIVSDIPGTTRDMVDIEVSYNENNFLLIDTAGLRRRGKIERGIEKFSSLRCMNAIERADVVVLLIDGDKGISSQDMHITEYAIELKKGIIIAINKIDLMDEEKKDRMINKLKLRFAFLPWAPVLFISAKQNINTEKIFDLSREIIAERKKRIPTSELNAFMQKLTHKHLPASTSSKKPKFMYITQADINPPKFVMHFKHPENLHFSYPRYLENSIRKEYGFNGTAVELLLKGDFTSENPKR